MGICFNWGFFELSYIELIVIFREEKNNLLVKKKWNNLNEDIWFFLGGWGVVDVVIEVK